MPRGTRGYVYVVDNPRMPGLVKVGGTGGSVRRRVRQLFTTGVPAPFVLRRCLRVTDWRAAEARVHRALAEHRCSADREFFAVPLGRAVAAAERACATLARPDAVGVTWPAGATVSRAPILFEAGGWSSAPDPLVAARRAGRAAGRRSGRGKPRAPAA